MNKNRDFKGVWIPKEIYLNTDLTLTEKILFVEISSLDNQDGCFASNEYFADFLGVGITTISKGVKRLIELGLIEIVSFNGRNRVLKVVNQDVTTNKADLQNVKGRDTETNRYINTNNKTSNKTTKYYTDFVSIYNNFCKKNIGVSCKMDGIQGKALKRIIVYLKKECKDESLLIESWKFILYHWNKLDDFHKKQIKLTQIDSNLINILNQLRNGKRQQVTNTEDSIRTRAGI